VSGGGLVCDWSVSSAAAVRVKRGLSTPTASHLNHLTPPPHLPPKKQRRLASEEAGRSNEQEASNVKKPGEDAECTVDWEKKPTMLQSIFGGAPPDGCSEVRGFFVGEGGCVRCVVRLALLQLPDHLNI
jgi:hypothetical protein